MHADACFACSSADIKWGTTKGEDLHDYKSPKKMIVSLTVFFAGDFY